MDQHQTFSRFFSLCRTVEEIMEREWNDSEEWERQKRLEMEKGAIMGIPVAELQHGALLIQVAVLVLSHSENLFVVIGFKARGYLVIRAALVGLEFTAGDTQGNAVAVYAVAVAPVFLGEHFAALIPEAEPALVVELHREFSVGEEVIGAGLVILRVFLPLVPGIGGVDLLAAYRAVMGNRLGQGAVIR